MAGGVGGDGLVEQFGAFVLLLGFVEAFGPVDERIRCRSGLGMLPRGVRSWRGAGWITKDVPQVPRERECSTSVAGGDGQRCSDAGPSSLCGDLLFPTRHGEFVGEVVSFVHWLRSAMLG
jgi:hypothetical protein